MKASGLKRAGAIRKVDGWYLGSRDYGFCYLGKTVKTARNFLRKLNADSISA